MSDWAPPPIPIPDFPAHLQAVADREYRSILGTLLRHNIPLLATRDTSRSVPDDGPDQIVVTGTGHRAAMMVTSHSCRGKSLAMPFATLYRHLEKYTWSISAEHIPDTELAHLVVDTLVRDIEEGSWEADGVCLFRQLGEPLGVLEGDPPPFWAPGTRLPTSDWAEIAGDNGVGGFVTIR